MIIFSVLYFVFIEKIIFSLYMLPHIPAEIERYIFSFLNPMFIPTPYKKSFIWCHNCGELLKNSEWIVMSNYHELYLDYTCRNCDHINQISPMYNWNSLIYNN